MSRTQLKCVLKLAVGAAVLAMSMGAQAATANNDVVVKVTFTNTSGSPQYVLKSHTPFEGVSAPVFEVTRDGQPVRYMGKIVKRAAPTAADYYLLKPGASYTVKVELSSLYDMATT